MARSKLNERVFTHSPQHRSARDHEDSEDEIYHRECFEILLLCEKRRLWRGAGSWRRLLHVRYDVERNRQSNGDHRDDKELIEVTATLFPSSESVKSCA